MLGHAFPNKGIFSNEVIHKTCELSIPPTASMIAQSTKLNMMTNIINLSRFSLIGHLNRIRFGPYWQGEPVSQTSTREETWKSVGTIISEKYLLARPKN